MAPDRNPGVRLGITIRVIAVAVGVEHNRKYVSTMHVVHGSDSQLELV